MAATGGTPGAHAEADRLLWEPQPAPRRGPRPTLSLEVIARTGIEIADRDGLTAVTMQKVADALGVTKMALYRYVPGKVELVALMTEAAVGEAPHLDTSPNGWRAQLQEWARTLFDRFVRHPWALETTVGARSIGPHEVGWMERAVAALSGTGLHGGEMLDVTATLAGHVRAMAQQVSAVDDAPERTMAAAVTALLHGREERFPAVTAALESAARHDSQDAALDFGLARILDGVELLVASRGQNTTRT
jgi:AcrR family transcriptional regulator